MQIQTPQQAAEGRETVTMDFPKAVRLTHQDGHFFQLVHYPAGTHQVPREHADHWFLKANGVREHQQEGK